MKINNNKYTPLDKFIDKVLYNNKTGYYMHKNPFGKKGDFITSKEVLSAMVDNYSRKDETAEAYYHLGYMALMNDFNLDLAKEYFEKSKSEKQQSNYGKR